MRSACRRSLSFLTATAFVVASGCALFHQGAAVLYRSAAKPRSDGSVLPPLQASRDTMELVIVFAERPVGDRLLGPALWREIDQIGSVSSDDRLSLERSGLRAGNAGNSISPELERLLNINTKPLDIFNSDDADTMKGRRSFLLSGSEDLIPINPLTTTTVKLPGNEEETREYQDATGMFRVWAHKVQEGWVRLEFQPEVHYGPSTMRRIASRNGWTTAFSQDIDPFASCRFSVNLHEGEMAVITSDGKDPQSLGSCCFITGEDNNRMQRVLVVRLSKMGRTEGVYAK